MRDLAINLPSAPLWLVSLLSKITVRWLGIIISDDINIPRWHPPLPRGAIHLSNASDGLRGIPNVSVAMVWRGEFPASIFMNESRTRRLGTVSDKAMPPPNEPGILPHIQWWHPSRLKTALRNHLVGRKVPVIVQADREPPRR